jgi:hypothetical protein
MYPIKAEDLLARLIIKPEIPGGNLGAPHYSSNESNQAIAAFNLFYPILCPFGEGGFPISQHFSSVKQCTTEPFPSKNRITLSAASVELTARVGRGELFHYPFDSARPREDFLLFFANSRSLLFHGGNDPIETLLKEFLVSCRPATWHQLAIEGNELLDCVHRVRFKQLREHGGILRHRDAMGADELSFEHGETL